MRYLREAEPGLVYSRLPLLWLRATIDFESLPDSHLTGSQTPCAVNGRYLCPIYKCVGIRDLRFLGVRSFNEVHVLCGTVWLQLAPSIPATVWRFEWVERVYAAASSLEIAEISAPLWEHSSNAFLL